MVPATTDERDAHAAEVAARFLKVKGFVPDLSYGEIDALAGFESTGHVRQIVEGGKVPGVPKTRRFAKVFGTTDAWLLCGAGEAPRADAVREAVAAARRRKERRQHEPRVRVLTGPRKAARPRSAARSAGARS